MHVDKYFYRWADRRGIFLTTRMKVHKLQPRRVHKGFKMTLATENDIYKLT
jgi:hypothetical protein